MKIKKLSTPSKNQNLIFKKRPHSQKKYLQGPRLKLKNRELGDNNGFSACLENFKILTSPSQVIGPDQIGQHNFGGGGKLP
jgi:hypothetical protein